MAIQCDFFLFVFSPEAMGVVTGCIFLIALFLYIPVPFLLKEKPIDSFTHNRVRSYVTWPYKKNSLTVQNSFNLKNQFVSIAVSWINIGSAIYLLHDIVGFRWWRSQFEMATQTIAAHDCIAAVTHGLLCEFQFDDSYSAGFCTRFSWKGTWHWYLSQSNSTMMRTCI